MSELFVGSDSSGEGGSSGGVPPDSVPPGGSNPSDSVPPGSARTLISRRNLIAGAVGAGVLVALGATASTVKAIAGELTPVRPPASQSEEHFIGACIRCNRCRGACPRQIIVNCDFEDGIINLRTPRLNFHTRSAAAYRRAEGTDQAAVLASPYQAVLAAGGTGFCDFCMLCAKTCPTGALTSFDPATQWIGEAVIDPVNCIAFEKLGGCRKCADYCPFDAISIDENRYPVVDAVKCNGCGICENICPSSTYRSFKGTTRRGINIEATGEARPQADAAEAKGSGMSIAPTGLGGATWLAGQAGLAETGAPIGGGAS